MLQKIKINHRRFLEKLWVWTQELLSAQFFLTLCSLPILLWWGLPLSWLTFFGNLFFNPFIMVFLVCSAFLFFFEILGLPSVFWVFLLEKVTGLWIWFIAWGSPKALVAFPCPPVWILMFIPLGAFFIIYRWRNHPFKKMLFLGTFLFCTGIFLRLTFILSPGAYPISAGRNILQFVYTGKQSFLIDRDAALRNGPGLMSWIDFKLRPFLVKTFGLVSCDALIVMHPTQARLKAAGIVAQRLQIPVIIVPSGKMAGVIVPPELMSIKLVQLSRQEIDKKLGLPLEVRRTE